jgi:hypothetical protein
VLGESLFFTCESKERKNLAPWRLCAKNLKKLDEIALALPLGFLPTCLAPVNKTAGL